MAPVGSRESLAAALQAGADSVYFGIHSANHFNIEDLREIAQTCSEHAVKTYLTVNTLIYDSDMADMRRIIDAAAEAGISAVIASDVAVMNYCREKGVEVHLSTQLNIGNVEALKFYAQFADVVVLARELNMEQVAYIHEQIEQQHITGPGGNLVRIEMFCHGALCMAVSGKCYMSLHAANRSANRGECTQICRRSYTVTDDETGNQLDIDNKYIMSPKDLKTVRFIAATRRPYRACSTALSPKKRRTSGTNASPRCSTVVSGTATTWDRRWANGTSTTDPWPRRGRSTWGAA